jgi:hypothetical protein
MEGRTLRIVVLVCVLLAGNAWGIERRRGHVRENQVPVCVSGCDFYYLEADSGYGFTNLKPDPSTALFLFPYVGMHVEVTGYSSGCGGCSEFYVSTIVQLSTDGVAGESELPGVPSLFQNYPNPFNPSTTIEYVLKREATVSLSIFDLLGREVSTLASSRQRAGEHRVAWDASAFPGGVYYYRLVVFAPREGSTVQTRAMALVR